MERDLPVATSLFQWPAWLGVLLAFSILYLVFRFYKKEKIWFFSWMWFFVALIPVSGIIPINALIYEHWLYFSLIGFGALSGFYVDRLLQLLVNKKNLRVFILIFFVGYFSFLTVQSIRRNILWGKPVEFYEDILKYSPDSVRITTNLASLYSEKGDLGKAEELFKRAIENPDGRFFAQPHYNLGNLYRDTGRIDEAVKQYQKAIETDPTFPFAYQNLAEVYVNDKRDLGAGIDLLEELKKIQPGNPRVYYNLGLLYLATESVGLAVENLELGLDLVSGRDIEVERAIKEILSRIK